MSQIYFKWCHKQYLVDHTPTTERQNQYTLWAKDTQSEQVFYLGSIIDGVVNKFEKYIDYPWDVQRGSERLYKLLWKYKDRFTSVGSYDIINRMTSITKEDRNRDLVQKRIANPKQWTWGRLGKLYNIKRFTARDIFQRDVDKYSNVSSKVGVRDLSTMEA